MQGNKKTSKPSDPEVESHKSLGSGAGTKR